MKRPTSEALPKVAMTRQNSCPIRILFLLKFFLDNRFQRGQGIKVLRNYIAAAEFNPVLLFDMGYQADQHERIQNAAVN